jgi:TRAP transporter 4TM/12TM fusion protein
MNLANLISIRTWFSVGSRRRPQGIYDWIFTPFAVAVGVWVITSATLIIISPWTLSVIFFSGVVALAFLTTGPFDGSDTNKPSLIDIILALISIAVGVYFAMQASVIINRIVLLDELTNLDILFGTLVFILTLEITRRTTGLGLTFIVVMFVLYNLFGHHLDGVLQHGKIDYIHFLEITVFTTDGIFGLPVRVAATYAFMFVMFGTVLHACGGGDFFFNFAAAVSGRSPGGPAKVAVISSGMYGMLSGSPTSDVVTTGSITIPIMKRLGYRGSHAGAIEVAASTGGSFVPPVLGTAAFLMVDFAGLEYLQIAVAAIIPATLYYTSIYAQVHFSCVRQGFGRLDDGLIPSFVKTIKGGWLFIIPLAVLTTALIMGYTPTMVGIMGTVAVVAVSIFKASTRIGPIKLARALSETCYRMVPVAGACAAAGLIIGGMTMTGLAGKFAHLVNGLTDGHMFLTLLVTACLTVVLGLGMPTPSAYILSAALMTPILSQIGVPTLPAHMFVFYYAVMSALTPPVAVAAYAASSIAEDNPLLIAVMAVKFALAAFIVPFAFVYGPELLMIGPWYLIAISFITAVIGLIFLAASLEAHLHKPLMKWERLFFLVVGLGFIVPNLYTGSLSLISICIYFIIFYYRKNYNLREKSQD